MHFYYRKFLYHIIYKFLPIICHYFNPAFSLHFIIVARNMNCFLETSRTCFKNTSTSIVPFLSASPRKYIASSVADSSAKAFMSCLNKGLEATTASSQLIWSPSSILSTTPDISCCLDSSTRMLVLSSWSSERTLPRMAVSLAWPRLSSSCVLRRLSISAWLWLMSSRSRRLTLSSTAERMLARMWSAVMVPGIDTIMRGYKIPDHDISPVPGRWSKVCAGEGG